MKKHRRYIPALVLTLISVALLTVAAIIVTNGLMPEGTPPATPNLADWISAIGQALGALGTAGALWLGAYTYLRQVREQHRAQAAGISLRIVKKSVAAGRDIAHVINSSGLPIYDVKVTGRNDDGVGLGGELEAGDSGDVVVDMHQVYFSYGTLRAAYVDFTDSNGTKWTRWAKGPLAERKRGEDGAQVLHIE